MLTHAMPDARVAEPGKTEAARPRLLLIADVPGWIFERHCFTLQRYLSSDFKIAIAYQDEPYDEDLYDLIYALEWHLVRKEWIKNPAKYLTGIRSHLFWTEWDFNQFADFLMSYFRQVHVVSKRLYDIFARAIPVALFSHGVDTDFFQPNPEAKPNHRAMRIGWGGNRKSPGKGYEDFIAPLGRLRDVQVDMCGYSDRNLTMQEMRSFYESLDVYVCASEREGNNNSLLEAAAMERAIVTTDNGTVPEYLEDHLSAMIVERSSTAIEDAVVWLRDHPEVRLALGRAARKAVIQRYDWKQRVIDHKLFFQGALQPNAPKI